jgi:hypothetical protein
MALDCPALPLSSWSGRFAPLSDAVRCHFEEEERPQIIRLPIVKDEVVAL